jgi:ribosome-binding protein aMBF1 (putative translation factor)
MAKYSTGGGGSGASESCELCGAEDVPLQTANVAGATLQVCENCSEHGETSGTTDDEDEERERERRKRAAQNTARMQDANAADAEHWEDGADYEDDPLPYLVSGYGEELTAARQGAGLQTTELAEEMNLDESDIIAIEQGRATQAGISGSVIAALEDRLDVELSE